MKLAEALARRADLQKRIAQLQHRATGVARFQEGEEPDEDAPALLDEARRLTGDLKTLVQRINLTNSLTEIEAGVTITDAIAERDALNSERNLVTEVAEAGSGRRGGFYSRQLRTELKEMTNLNVRGLRGEADRLAMRHRELDVRIQQANWATDLRERGTRDQ